MRREIIPELGNFPDVTEIQKLPDEVEKWALMPGRTLRGGSAAAVPGAVVPAAPGRDIARLRQRRQYRVGERAAISNPNWSDEQKKLYDMLREKLGL